MSVYGNSIFAQSNSLELNINLLEQEMDNFNRLYEDRLLIESYDPILESRLSRVLKEKIEVAIDRIKKIIESIVQKIKDIIKNIKNRKLNLKAKLVKNDSSDDTDKKVLQIEQKYEVRLLIFVWNDKEYGFDNNSLSNMCSSYLEYIGINNHLFNLRDQCMAKLNKDKIEKLNDGFNAYKERYNRGDFEDEKLEITIRDYLVEITNAEYDRLNDTFINCQKEFIKELDWADKQLVETEKFLKYTENEYNHSKEDTNFEEFNLCINILNECARRFNFYYKYISTVFNYYKKIGTSDTFTVDN